MATMGAGLLMSVGCASFMNSPITSVTIDSNPQNAQFVIEDHNGEVIHSGTTPADVSLRNSKAVFQRAQYVVRFESAGLSPQTTPLNATLSPFYFGNLLILYPGVFGFLVIDPFTGAIYDLPDVHYVDLNTLNNEAATTISSADLLTVALGGKQ